MNLQPLSCPNCGAKLEPENDLDMFYCDYCGFKIMNDDPARREAIVRLKESENARKIKEIDADVEKHRINSDAIREKNRNHHITIREKSRNRHNTIQSVTEAATKDPALTTFFGYIFLCIFIFLMLGLMLFTSNRKEDKEEARVQAVYNEVVSLMEDGEYEDALRRAELIEYDSTISRDKAEEWKQKKRNLIALIKEEMGVEHAIITISEKPSYYTGKNYKDVELLFEEMGFTDISVEKIRENTIGTIFYSSGEVVEISINGSTDFKKGNEFRDDAVIIIRYKI